MYNYYIDTVWSVNIALAGMLVVASFAIFACVVFKDRTWEKRRKALVDIKKDVYEILLAREGTSQATCQPLLAGITAQQFIDITTNRNIHAAFFNQSEQEFFKKCFVNPGQIAGLEKIVKRPGSKWRRIEAILALGYTQSKAAVGILKESASNRDMDVVYFSMISLGQIKTPESAAVLLNILRKDPAKGHKVVAILKGFSKEIADDVMKLANYHDPIVRYWALKLMSGFASAKYIKEFEKLTQDQSEDVRAAACDCLGLAGQESAKPAVQKCLKDESWLVRSHAIPALSKLIGAAALPEVIGYINDASWSIVNAVKDVMTEHIEASLPFIEKFLAGDYDIAKRYSIIALENSGYLKKLLINIVSGTGADKALAERILRGVIESRIHSGLDSALGSLSSDTQAKTIEALMKLQGR